MIDKPPPGAFTRKETKLIRELKTPAKVQRYFSSLPYNWEENGATLRSFREVVKHNQAHCLEAAVGAAVADAVGEGEGIELGGRVAGHRGFIVSSCGLAVY